MQNLIIDCATGATSMVTLSPGEQSALLAQQAVAAKDATTQQTSALAATAARAAAIQTVLTSKAIAGDPALQAALACLLGVPVPTTAPGKGA